MFPAVFVKINRRSGVRTLAFDALDHALTESIVHYALTHRETKFLRARRTHRRRRPGTEGPTLSELSTASDKTVVLE